MWKPELYRSRSEKWPLTCQGLQVDNMVVNLLTLAGERPLLSKSEKWPFTCQGVQVDDQKIVKSEKWPFTCHRLQVNFSNPKSGCSPATVCRLSSQNILGKLSKSEKWPYTCQGLQVECQKEVQSEKWLFTC